MRIIKANAQIIRENDFPSKYSFIEYIGRTCYKSTDHMTEESGMAFVKGLIKNKHLAMLEHSHIYLKTRLNTAHQIALTVNRYAIAPGKHIQMSYYGGVIGVEYISLSFRTVIELIDYCEENGTIQMLVDVVARYYSNLFEGLYTPAKRIVEPDIYVLTREQFVNDVTNTVKEEEIRDAILRRHLTHTVLFTCDRGVSHELVRHRVASFAQESTRYCNYAKDKFGNEIAVIEPCTLSPNSEAYTIWQKACIYAEKCYFALLDQGVKAQMARDVLPTSLKTEIVVTASEDEWQHILNLRLKGTTGAPHPQMKEIMEIAYPLLHETTSGRLSI